MLCFPFKTQHVKTDVFSFHSTKMGEHSKTARHQESSSVTNFRQSGSSSAQWKPMSDSAFSQMSQNSPSATFSTQSKQSRPVAHPISSPNGPPVHVAQPEKSSWRFTHSFGSQTDENRGTSHYQDTRKNKVQVDDVHQGHC